MSGMSLGFRATGPGTNLLPLASIYAIANRRLVLKEVHVVNTTAVAVAIALQRLTSAGTASAETGETQRDVDTATVIGDVRDTHTSTGPTITAGFIEAWVLGAVIGSGVVWEFKDPDRPLIVPAGTANGIGVTIPTGTGQICDVTFVWDE